MIFSVPASILNFGTRQRALGTAEEAKQFVEAEFEYVSNMEGTRLFRKHKKKK
jgi:hypothetical protein